MARRREGRYRMTDYTKPFARIPRATAPPAPHHIRPPSIMSVLPTPETLFTCRPDTMDWVPWAMPGAHFKLLHANAATGHFTLLIRFAAGAEAPIHRHVGAVEGYMLEGGFYYKDDPDTRFDAGSYLYEEEGAVHQPVSPHGGVMFAVFHGPVEGLDEDGNLTG